MTGIVNPAAISDDFAYDEETGEEAPTINEFDVESVLVAFIHKPPLGRKHMDWLTRDVFERYMYARPHQVVIWEVLGRLLRHEQMATTMLTFLKSGVMDTAKREFGDPAIGERAIETLDMAAGVDPAHIPMSWINTILRNVYQSVHHAPALSNVMASARAGASDLRSITNAIEDLERRDVTLFGEADEEAEESDPFKAFDQINEPFVESDESGTSETEPRILTGVNYIDALHAGRGIYRGFNTMIAGPTGGGKTIASNDLMAKLSAQGRSVGVFNTEESVVKDLEPRARLFAACSDIKVQAWVDAECDPRRLPPDQRMTEAAVERIKRVRENLKFYQIEMPTLSSILNALDQHMLTTGKMHDVVMLDWAGPVAKAMIEDGEAQSDHEALERLCFHLFQKVAKKYGCAVVIFHQLAEAAVQRQGVYGEYTRGDTQNCKKMAQHCAAVHVITPCISGDGQDPLGRYIGVKTRFDKEGTYQIVEKDYQHSRFTTRDDMSMLGRSFVSAKSDGAYSMKNRGKRV